MSRVDVDTICCGDKTNDGHVYSKRVDFAKVILKPISMEETRKIYAMCGYAAKPLSKEYREGNRNDRNIEDIPDSGELTNYWLVDFILSRAWKLIGVMGDRNKPMHFDLFWK